VVLVPREAAWLLRLLVDRLVPVEVDVVSDEVVAEVGEERRAREPAEEGGARDQVDRERDRARLEDHEAALRLGPEESLGLRVEGVDLGDDVGDVALRERAVEDDVAVAIELLGLRGREGSQPGGRSAPREAAVPRVERGARRKLSHPLRPGSPASSPARRTGIQSFTYAGPTGVRSTVPAGP